LTDVFAIQDEIASSIAEVLKIKLTAKPTDLRSYVPNQAAHDAYLKAQYHWGKVQPESQASCKKHLEQAMELDPNYAMAHYCYADFLFRSTTDDLPAHEAMPIIREKAQRALDIDPSLPEAHALLGAVASVYDYDWKEAEHRFQLAMAQGSVSSRTRQLYGFFNRLPLNRTQEAIEQLRLGIQSDPLDILAGVGLACALIVSGRLNESLVEAQKILELEANHPWALYTLAATYAFQEKWREVIQSTSQEFPIIMSIRAAALKRMGQVDAAEELIQKLLPAESYVGSNGRLIYYLIGGEIDKAAKWMKRCLEQRHPMAVVFVLRQFQSTDYWPALAKLANLPEEAQ
jgi:tetratricopeptide (TPR) repeat protein